MELNMQVEVKTEDVLNGKFKNTLSTLEGFLMEAYGDIQNDTSYSAKGVHNRFEEVKTALLSDLESLQKSIVLVAKSV